MAFEAMVNEARECAIDLLQSDAAHSKLIEVAFHHSALTAKPLFEILRTLIIEFLKLPDVAIVTKDQHAFSGVLATIAGEYDELVAVRNRLVHGTWYIGYSTAEDPNSENFFLALQLSFAPMRGLAR